MKRFLLSGLLFFMLTHLSFSQIVINEICPANGDINYDPDYFNFSGWIELYNTSSSAISVSGYYLSDDAGLKSKWQIPYPASVPANGYLIIWADGRGTGRHANFKMDSDGGTVILSKNNLSQADAITYSRQYTNVSYGRKADGDPTWTYLAMPTPLARNSGTSGTERLAEPSFSKPAGRYNGSQSVTITHENSNVSIRYTTNGSEPTPSSSLYSGPVTISSTAVLKAKAFADGFIPGKTESATYFINEHAFTLPVVSLSLKNDYLENNVIGIYVEGTNGISGNCNDRLVNWNQDWDRHSYFEYFGSDGKRILGQNIDIRIGGACSRNNPQKALVLNPRDKYGKKTVDYNFFSTKPVEEFGGLMLRNAGNDFWGAYMRDALAQSLPIGQMDVDYMAYQPSIVYLNGRYWGIQNLREKIDGDYIESNYGIDKSDVDLIETWGNAIEGSADKYNAYLSSLSRMDLTTDAAYTFIDENIDVQEYINYLVTEIYVGNTDWPGNNVKFWRQRSTNGKFRWILWDLDFGFSLYGDWASNATHQTLNFATATDGPGWPNPPASTLHIRYLLSNPTFRTRFIQTLTASLSTTFKPARVVDMINTFQNRIKTEMPYHVSRWQQSLDNWNWQVQVLRDFALQRNEFMKGHISSFFALGQSVTLNTAAFPASGGGVVMNGITTMAPVEGGIYYKGVPLTISAAPAAGYTFSHFKIKRRDVTAFDFITRGDTWKYFDQGMLPSPTWNAVSYSDAAWQQGPAQLGYGDGDEKTVVSYGPDASNKYITTYFRKSFEVADLSGLENLTGSILFDDGAVIYLNGEEVFRSNLPAGVIQYSTLAAANVPNEMAYNPFTIPKEKLLQGTNVISVEVHQNGVTSSDVSFDLELRSYKTGAEAEIVVNEPTFTEAVNSDVTVEAYYVAAPVKEGIIINEVSASNNTYADPFGGKDDWIELYNKGTETVDIAGFFITDDPAIKTKHRISAGSHGETEIAPGEYKILWADGEVLQGPLHLNFKLSADGESVAIYQQSGVTLNLVDNVTFGAQSSLTSYSRIPNVTGPFVTTMAKTPMSENQFEAPLAAEEKLDSEIQVFPNPTPGDLSITARVPVTEMRIYNGAGQLVWNKRVDGSQLNVDLERLSPGLYSIVFYTSEGITVRRIIKN